MKKIGIIYGSSSGTTEGVAKTIAKKLQLAKSDVYDAAKVTEAVIKEYEILLLGSSTWGDGDLQDDWEDALKILKKTDLSGKAVAIFGCGDSGSYGDTFCDAIGILYKELQETGCEFYGSVETEGYDYSSSQAEVNGKFIGLPLDETNEDDKTDERIDKWIETLKTEIIN